MAAPTHDKAKEAYWRKAIWNQKKSGMNITKWCLEHKQSRYAFHWWKRKLAKHDRQHFTRVDVANPASPVTVPVPTVPGQSGFTLELPDTGTLNIPHGFDAAELRRLIQTLRQASC